MWLQPSQPCDVPLPAHPAGAIYRRLPNRGGGRAAARLRSAAGSLHVLRHWQLQLQREHQARAAGGVWQGLPCLVLPVGLPVASTVVGCRSCSSASYRTMCMPSASPLPPAGPRSTNAGGPHCLQQWFRGWCTCADALWRCACAGQGSAVSCSDTPPTRLPTGAGLTATRSSWAKPAM